VHRSVSGGVSRYVGTGRELATTRSSFSNTFERYALSHLGPSLDMFFLIVLFLIYSALSLRDKIGLSLAPIIVCFSWLIAPALYNPYGFSMSSLLDDWRKWRNWLNTPAFDNWRLGQKENARSGDFNNSNWFFQLNAEPATLRLLDVLLRIALWGGATTSILLRMLEGEYEAALGSTPTTGQLLTAHRVGELEHHIGLFLFIALLLALVVRFKPAVMQVSLAIVVVICFVASWFAGTQCRALTPRPTYPVPALCARVPAHPPIAMAALRLLCALTSSSRWHLQATSSTSSRCSTPSSAPSACCSSSACSRGPTVRGVPSTRTSNGTPLFRHPALLFRHPALLFRHPALLFRHPTLVRPSLPR
jgi:hypothetical protein